VLNGSTPESDEEGDSTRTLGPGTPLTQGDVSRRLFSRPSGIETPSSPAPSTRCSAPRASAL
jgi:hypothetical protein